MHVPDSRCTYQAASSVQLRCCVAVLSANVTQSGQRNAHTDTPEGLMGIGHDLDHQEHQQEPVTLSNSLHFHLLIPKGFLENSPRKMSAVLLHLKISNMKRSCLHWLPKYTEKYTEKISVIYLPFTEKGNQGTGENLALRTGRKMNELCLKIL